MATRLPRSNGMKIQYSSVVQQYFADLRIRNLSPQTALDVGLESSVQHPPGVVVDRDPVDFRVDVVRVEAVEELRSVTATVQQLVAVVLP